MAGEVKDGAVECGGAIRPGPGRQPSATTAFGGALPHSGPGRVIWITGLSGSGKTSLARALMPRLSGPKLLLDGDELREALALLGGGYDLAARRRLALTYARLAKLAADQGQTVVCATISMFHEVRDWNRQNLPGYLEVYLAASAEDCRAHDFKRVYEGDQAMGQQLPPELPLQPDLSFIAHCQPSANLAGLVMDRLSSQGKR